MTGRVTTFLKVLLSCLALLVAAQAFNGVLTLSSLERLYSDILTSGFRISGHDAASKIETAMRLGKPLERFFGFDRLEESLREDLPEARHVFLVTADGTIVQAAEAPPAEAGALVAEALKRMDLKNMEGARHGLSSLMVEGKTDRYVVFPLVDSTSNAVDGALVLGFSSDLLRGKLRAVVESSLGGFLLATGAAALILLLSMKVIMRQARMSGGKGIRFLFIPAVILIGAQVFHSVETVRLYRDAYVDAARESMLDLMGQVRDDIQFVVDKGLGMDRLKGIEKRLADMIVVVPELAGLTITDTDGAVMNEAKSPVNESAEALTKGAITLSGMGAGDERLTLTMDIVRNKDGEKTVVGHLIGELDPVKLEISLRDRVLDAATVLLVSLFFMFEMFVLFGIAIHRSMSQDSAKGVSLPSMAKARDAAREEDEQANRHLLARPIGFALLFAWAMPLSFIPLRMRELPDLGLDVSPSLLLALPLSVEALCALFTALLAGRLSDRHGWRMPFLVGLVVSVAGAVASGLATEPTTFIASRGLTGLGYGLSWMGIQGYIFQHAPPGARAQGISNLISGLLAGYLCGTAIGAMLAERFGYGTVFLISSVVMVTPGILAVTFLHRYMRGGPPVEGRKMNPETDQKKGSLAHLLTDRRFLAVMIFSVVPFSVAQVGLLYFTVPLYLNELGLNQSNIGRILMIYGISVIYLGPVISRRVDITQDKRWYIISGGVVGALGLMGLAYDGGLVMVVLGVFLLGLCSCLSESARSAFAMALPVTKAYGTTSAMSVQRAADKLGQMIGPLMLGALFSTLGIQMSVALTGSLFLVATVLFFFMTGGLTPSIPPRSISPAE
ncbi:MAG: MFS transporter [Rhodospirillum sp.]|nr:MFS transporter [Rhodospirillum sp.]MCF8488159.1 MFS transporter [Rhodospirillum sp.]MCF8503024.1 MFS transporter [Rhodospirillum sp.]